jgi:uncharacterized protein DUF4157
VDDLKARRSFIAMRDSCLRGVLRRNEAAMTTYQHIARTAPAQAPAVAARSPITVQRKMTVSAPGDQYEREADRVADEVMRMPADDSPPTIQRMCTECSEEQSVQRMCTDCSEEQEVQRQVDDEEEGTLQGKREGASPSQAPAGFGARLDSLGGGSELPAAARAHFEPRFGRRFDNVRVHDGNAAAALAGSVRARAFTVGRDIVFGSGQFAPQSERGQRLVAHELVHTIQQSGGEGAAVQRQGEEGDQQPQAAETGLIDGLVDPRPMLVPDGISDIDPQEQAMVQRAASDDVLDHPEESAAAETPYETGVSRGALAAALGEGRPLDAVTRDSMEARYNRSLGGLRVHTDGAASSLADRFSARAFAFDNHIAFASGAFAPGNDRGQRLLRHEISHAVAPTRAATGVFRACTTNCPAAGATAYASNTDTGTNCYGYAVGTASILRPGAIARTSEWRDRMRIQWAEASTPADLRSILPYFTVSHVKANTEADLTTALSSDCANCCSSPKRKVIEVTTPPVTSFRRGVDSSGSFTMWLGITSGTDTWDFHWYRKDADRSWSHKRGGTPSQQADAAGTTPICNPCTASRSYPGADYSNVVGSWCV